MADDPWAKFRTAPTTQAADPWAAFRAQGDAPKQVAGQTSTVPGTEANQERGWSDVPLEALKNVPASAGKFVTDIVQPILHPIDTAKAIGNVAGGVLQKVRNLSPEGSRGSAPAFDESGADAVGQFFKDRYGSMEGLKKTLATDPVGFLADLSVALTGGSSLAARAPALAGRTTELVGQVGRAVDPINVAVQAGKGVAKAAEPVVSATLGNMTGTGMQSVRTAASAGKEGGEAGQAFRDNMRGNVPMENVVQEARDAVKQLREDRAAAYRTDKKLVDMDKTVLDFDKIDDALVKMSAVKVYKGQDLAPKTQSIRQEIGEAIRDWKALDPKEFHTVEGMDALKQKIGNIREGTQYGTPDRVVADQAYNAIKKTINEQAPGYAKVMKDYERASSELSEIEKTLSVKPGKTNDAALRKLQSILRNNASTNYGNRVKLVDRLDEAGGGNIVPSLAGQAMNSWTPRGLQTLMPGAAIGAGALGNPGMLALLPLMSPRITGEAAHMAGRGVGGIQRGAKATGITPDVLRMLEQLSFQTGRVANQ